VPEATQRPAVWKISVLSVLYFAQGLPFGFQSKGLKLALTELGLPMAAVTLSSALSLPWSFKPLLAPFVDRHGSERLGRRKSWILPLQLGLAVSCAAAAFATPSAHLTALLVAVFFMNLFAAAQDVPVDGLAVDLLGAQELGAGNAVQVVGYKVGMLVGGSILVSQLPVLGWQLMCLTMAGLCLAVTGAVALVREPPRPAERSGALTWRELGQRLKVLVTNQGAGWLLLFVATYKLGETLVDVLFEPWLLRVQRIELSVVAIYGGWGMVGSLVGSAAGGLLATRLPPLRAVGWAAAVRSLSLIAMWAMVAGLVPTDSTTIIAVTTVEHFFVGLLTTTMFAYMMSQVDKRIGATHFTLLAAVEVAGKSVPSLAAGAFVDAFGWAPVFLAGLVLSAAFLLLFIPLRASVHQPAG